MDYLFAVVNYALEKQLAKMKVIFSTGQGDYKNVLYPDLETAYDICMGKSVSFMQKEGKEEETDVREEEDCIRVYDVDNTESIVAYLMMNGHPVSEIYKNKIGLEEYYIELMSRKEER